MKLNVVLSSDQPLYAQIYDQIRFQILRRELLPGSPLPPIRTVAQELKISVISVKRAWEDLAREGYIDTMVGRGSFVAELSQERVEALRMQIIAQQLAPALRACQDLGASREEILESVRDQYK